MNAFTKQVEEAAKHAPMIPIRRQAYQPTLRKSSQRSLLQVQISPGVFNQLLLETGELVGYQAKQPHRIKKYVGEETVWPKQATHEDALTEAMRVHDRWANNLTYFADRVLDLLDTGLGQNPVRVLKWLCQGVSGRNVWFGHTSSAEQALGMSRATVTRAVSELAKAGLIRTEQQGRGKPTRVNIHPWYVFKGDRQVQEQYLTDWVRDQISVTQEARQTDAQI